MNWQQKLAALNTSEGIEKLQLIMSMLRDPEHGCPWDLKQTFKTIVPHTLEEAYEVAEAIEQEDFEEIPKELGDLLFQVVFYAQLGQEEQRFDFTSIANTMSEKLIRRHPHVFGGLSEQTLTDQQIKYNWEQIKAEERQQKGTITDSEKTSILDDIPAALPSLTRAYKVQKRVAHVGFDWPNVEGALDKVEEEIVELRAELKTLNANKKEHLNEQQKAMVADELGDLFFALTNVSRHLGLNPEQVSRQATDKFSRRFQQVEVLANEQSEQGLASLSLEQMDQLWNTVKSQE